jgi:hypothetical protein
VNIVIKSLSRFLVRLNIAPDIVLVGEFHILKALVPLFGRVEFVIDQKDTKEFISEVTLRYGLTVHWKLETSVDYGKNILAGILKNSEHVHHINENYSRQSN